VKDNIQMNSIFNSPRLSLD